MPDLLINRDKIDFSTNSSAKEVVVFSDKALVKRTMECTLKRGENRIMFNNLGTDIIEDSIKVKTDPGDVRIISSSSVINNLYFFKAEENDKLYERMIENLKEIIRITDEKNINQVCSNIIRDLRNYIGCMQNNIILESEVSIHKLKESFAFLEKILKDNSVKMTELDDEALKIRERLEVLYSQIESVKHLDKKVQSNIEVTLFSENEYESIVEISYILPNVRWEAVYDSILLDRNEIDFYYFGNITQWTGEDWVDAKLSLSTAVVENTMEIPLIYPVYLESVFQKRDKELVMDAKDIKSGFDKSSGPTEEEADGSGQVVAEKKVISHIFNIEKPVTVPSDGMNHKVIIFNEKIKCDVYHETVPELMPHVYLKASFVNMTALPFLPGANSIYRNGSFMGRAVLKYVSHNEKADISFGIDDDIRIMRIVLLNAYEKSKNILDKNTWNKEIKFVFKNFSDVPKKVILKEGIYVSELNEVNVSIKPETTPGYKSDKDGIIVWEVDLDKEPTVFTEILLSYKMESQRNFDMNNFY
jgi:uncharacterized protein (TIGR02231 family)